MRAHLVCLLLAFLGWSCGEEPPQPPRRDCGCVAPDAPWTGEATLTPHTGQSPFLGSVISFAWATTVDRGEVKNDWDLSLTGDLTSREHLAFRVNLVTDDQSCIEDLGVIPIASVPASISRCGDQVRVIEGHVYLVENHDPDQQQFAAFAVTHLDGVRSATLQWYRSSRPDRFSFER